MRTSQRVVRRNRVFSRLLTCMVYLSLLLLAYSVWRTNAPDTLTDSWPWKLELLDGQSATTAVVGSMGAALARGQYARAVRPALGYYGRATADIAPDDRLVWACHVVNAAQDVAVVDGIAYRVVLTGDADPTDDETGWVDRERAKRAIEERGPVDRSDFSLHFISADKPLPAQGLMLIGWFTEEAMAEVRDVHVRLRVTDRVGDTHERIIDVLKGADRSLRRVDPPLF
ncbi:hypothetical protein JI76_04315 [Streptomyces anulatus]|uniref:hypothetical protein n=1 Tax=Streptomyces anulatus TaxID=1892 RepID=UPI0006DBD179|nr:hypothetical protein [Streptomyces anulatus]KPL36184.1 hypothetical protein JI76_04315 [Streptomyces anulatus]